MTGYKYVLKQKKENEDTCYNIPCFSFNPMLNKLRLAKSCLLHDVQYCFVYKISSCYKIKS